MDTNRHESESNMVLAFQEAGIPVKQQSIYSIRFKGRQLGEYIPDLIAGDSVVVGTKVIDRITDHERGQMLNYFKITGASDSSSTSNAPRLSGSGSSSDHSCLFVSIRG